MKYSKYYHSNISCYDIYYNKWYIISDCNKYKNIDVNNLKQLIILFNIEQDDINNKYVLYNSIIDIIGFDYFGKCRYCNKSVITLKSKLQIKLSKTFNLYFIQSYVPSVQYRVLDNVYYKLSCCQQCYYNSINKYVDNRYINKIPLPKYWYMKNGISASIMFGYSFSQYKKLASSTTAVTLKSMINKWGVDEGNVRWANYCNKQAQTNSFKYKHLKYNISKEEFDLYNKSRAITKANLTTKYGIDLGLEKYTNYIKKQKDTKSWDYMVNKYGIERAKLINRSKLPINLKSKSYSNISQQLFKEIDDIIYNKLQLTNIHTYYYIKTGEYIIYNEENNKYYLLDCYIPELKLCIEFFGDYWHANPIIYKKDDTIVINNIKRNVTDIWQDDKHRIDFLKRCYNINTIIIWENDYKNKKDEVISKLINEITIL